MQPRERLVQNGVQDLSDHELIALLIGTGIKGYDYAKLARLVLRMIRGSNNHSDYSTLYPALRNIPGIGVVKYSRLASALEFGRRLYLADTVVRKFQNSSEVYTYFDKLRTRKQEVVRALYLNGRYELISDRLIALGSLNSVAIQPRDIIKHAITDHASSIIMAHNHPSGDPTPSLEDINVTKRVINACEIMGVKFIEHIVIAKNGWKSINFEGKN